MRWPTAAACGGAERADDAGDRGLRRPGHDRRPAHHGRTARLHGVGGRCPRRIRLRRRRPARRGRERPSDAVPLEPGVTYRSSLPRDGTLYYRLDLDAASDAYVAVTAVPGTGEVTAVDGVRVSVQDADGTSCSSDSATFGAARSPRPVTAWAVRETDPGGTRCQEPGTYYVTVERSRPEDSPPQDWDLELSAVTEPRPREVGASEAPESWDSASPEPVAGEAERRAGGDGFADATPVGPGAWRDDIRPGQTLFYRVPVDWGRRLHATAELGGSGDRSGYATAALRLALHNPVRGEVDDAAKGYTGRGDRGRPRSPAAGRLRQPVRGRRPGRRDAVRRGVLPGGAPRRPGGRRLRRGPLRPDPARTAGGELRGPGPSTRGSPGPGASSRSR